MRKKTDRKKYSLDDTSYPLKNVMNNPAVSAVVGVPKSLLLIFEYK